MRRMVGLTSTILMTVSIAPWPVHMHGAKAVREKTSDPDSSQNLTRLGTVLHGRRIALSQLSGSAETSGVVYSLANNRVVRVEQIGFPDLVTGHRVQSAEHKPPHKRIKQHTTSAVYHSPPATTMLSSRGSSLSGIPAVNPKSANEGATIAKYALHFVGAPYRWGGEGPAGFDCSGLSAYVYSLVHIDIARTSAAQFDSGAAVSRDHLLPGDLVFFHTDAPGASHVAIYVGNDLIVQALNDTTGVVVSRLSDRYYASRYLGARRLW